MKNIFKSIWACFAGILIGVVLSLGTDKILEMTAILPEGNLWVSASLIWFVIAYRTVYNIIGSYFVARLAPNHPMRHAIIVGVLDTIVSIIGAVVNINMNLGPEWYCWTLVALALPGAWVGGKLFVMESKKRR
jgi:hypothetical protein